MRKKIQNNHEIKTQFAIMGDKKALIELKKAAFHLRKVIQMVQAKEYCLDIIRESRIAEEFLKKAHSQILTYHFEKCVKGVLEKQGKNKQTKELIWFLKEMSINHSNTQNGKHQKTVTFIHF